MTRNILLSNRLREVLLEGHWIANTNYKEQLKDLSWEQVTFKVGNLNTIAALTFHINYYLKGLLDAFEHNKLEIRDKYSFDFPPITKSSDWDDLFSDFKLNSEKFIQKVQQMDDEIFDQPFIDERYGTVLRNIEGVIEHSYYHLGQIVIIRKMMLRKTQ